MKRRSATGGLEIVIDDGPLANVGEEDARDGSADCVVLGGGAAYAPATYSAFLSNNAVPDSPSAPHPFWMKPPPPDGPPPPLLSNKRAHGSCNAPGTSSSPSTVSANVDAEVEMPSGDLNGASNVSSFSANVYVTTKMVAGHPSKAFVLGANVDAEMEMLAAYPCMTSSSSANVDGELQMVMRCRDTSSATSASSASSSCDSEHQEPSPEANEDKCDADILEAAPEMPPGPPPAWMAPPPPDGPPPDLPLDRAELKRAVEDSANSPIRKRLRSTSITNASGGVSGEERSQAGCSTDGESSASSWDSVEGRDTDLNVANSQCGPTEAGLELSYSQSPPSARWVWDQIVQQDRQPANIVVLEKRMLQALDALHFGAEETEAN